MERLMRRIRAIRASTALWFVAALLGGCASVPSSSAPQAIGTVERPAPSNLPKPTPGMDPDVLLREFLKATADPANRHLAARQFLTQSASNAWDDAGSALLIDHVVFVETRGAERVSATMRADILGSLSDIGVFETAEGQLPDPGPIELVKTPVAGASTGCPTGFSWTGSSSRRPTSATPCTSPTRPARPWFRIRAMSRCPITTSWPPSWCPSCYRVHVRR
ncbi:hypothetical protein NIIDMKKI_58690 [Mycobacterium kansasii]|uniref:Lipoprotein LpqB N-terminal domain-containing protein n=1 Tax=Mycobacterium kansasii TaxID=1768 RepID=A0A7G1IL71_MYCKA|nr:hypothetical protein NIIDMKKI_58690 [Mycobacterium kansasii]